MARLSVFVFVFLQTVMAATGQQAPGSLQANPMDPAQFPKEMFNRPNPDSDANWKYASATFSSSALNKNSQCLVVLPNAWLIDYVVEEHSNQGIRILDSGTTGRGVVTALRSRYDYRATTRTFSATGNVVVKFRLEEHYSIFKQTPLQLQLYPLEEYYETRLDRNLWQALFLGGLLLMAFYNLFLWFSVRDASYFHYVSSILGIGLYFAFYYGFGMEVLWPASPRWDLWSYTIIVPFTALARLWFTRTYLHTPSLMPRLNGWLNWLAAFMSATLLAGLFSYLFSIDWLKPLVTVIGVVNTLILIIMLVAGIVGFRKGYYPALFFILANAPLVLGAILFILRELHVFPDSWFTRYFVQLGVLFQAVLFAFGLASRFNRARAELELEKLQRQHAALEAEREKKMLIEVQRQQLQEQVDKQTQSLRNKNKKLQQLNALKDKLFSVITHDLRNPLATMQSFLKLLTEHHNKLSEAEKQQLTSEAQDTLDHLNRLLYYLLQWSKSQMNLLAFSPETLSASTLLQKNVRVFHLQAHLKNITLKAQAQQDCSIFGDAHMVDFVIRNLLSNAIKFSREGQEILIKAEQNETGTTVQIVDEGVGMTAETVHEIMEANVGASRRGTFKEKGTGLGLLICKDFIARHEGRLQVVSSPNHGTTVTVFFPAAANTTA